MDEVCSIRFGFYRCKNLVVPSTFSQDDLLLSKRNAYCFANDVLRFKSSWLVGPGNTSIPEMPAIKMFLEGLKHSNLNALELGFHTEKQAFMEVAEILKNFCTNITLSAMSYNDTDADNFTDKTKIKIEHLGMGVAETWRGIPDARLRGSALHSDITVMSGSILSHDDGSNGTTAVCEAKLKINPKKNLSQLVKTCVVASFVEKNLHPDLPAMVPSILIDTKNVMVALYCAKTDLLLVSDMVTWRKQNCFDLPGIFLLWAMINHRYEIVIF